MQSLLPRILWSLGIGGLSGFIGGMFGVAGSIVMLPALVISGVFKDYQTIVGTVLFAMLPPISILAVYEYYQRKQIDYLMGVLLCVGFMLASGVGAMWNKHMSERFLKRSASVIFLILAVVMYYL